MTPNALLDLKRFEEALAAFDRALEIDPENAIAHANRGSVLNHLKRFEEAVDAYDRALECGFRNPNLMNMVAWARATPVNPKMRDAARAVALAKAATRLVPNEGAFWNTLGVALCVAGRSEESLKALERSMKLRKGGNAFDWFFVAMAKHKLSQVDARGWYDKAVVWMENNKPDNKELKRFRAEAEAVLGIKE